MTEEPRIIRAVEHVNQDAYTALVDGPEGIYEITISGLDYIRSKYESWQELAYAKYFEKARALHGSSSAQSGILQESGSSTIGR